MKLRSKSTGSTNTTLIVGLLLILIVGGAVYILTPENKEALLLRVFPGLSLNKEDLLNKKGMDGAKPTVKPTPTIRPIFHGRIDVAISTSAKPGMEKAVIDPFDPKKGEKQTISVHVYDENSDVASVQIKWKGDTLEKTYDLRLVSGTNRNGQWQGSWTVEDTMNYTYLVTFVAKNAAGATNSVQDTIRDEAVK